MGPALHCETKLRIASGLENPSSGGCVECILQHKATLCFVPALQGAYEQDCYGGLVVRKDEDSE